VKKIKVVVHSPHALFDGKGALLSNGHEYVIPDDDVAARLMLEGLISISEVKEVPEVKEKPEVQEEVKKSTTTKTPKAQDTESLIQ
jgi:hypothetical protein